MKRILCFFLAHDVMPTGRRGFMLAEWRCRRCGTVLISYDEGNRMSYCGYLFPRAKYEGMKFTVFPSDASIDRAMMKIRQVNDLLNPGWDSQ